MYRTKDVFGIGGVRCSCDDVMQVACDALDEEQHEEVQYNGSGLTIVAAERGSVGFALPAVFVCMYSAVTQKAFCFLPTLRCSESSSFLSSSTQAVGRG